MPCLERGVLGGVSECAFSVEGSTGCGVSGYLLFKRSVPVTGGISSL